LHKEFLLPVYSTNWRVPTGGLRGGENPRARIMVFAVVDS
jgi:hypothetical protein